MYGTRNSPRVCRWQLVHRGHGDDRHRIMPFVVLHRRAMPMMLPIRAKGRVSHANRTVNRSQLRQDCATPDTLSGGGQGDCANRKGKDCLSSYV
jgi:hypothetical protein